VTSGGNNFNDFPDNQLTKFRVFNPGFYPLKFLWIAVRPSPHRMDPPDRHNGQRQTNDRQSVVRSFT